VEQEAKYTMLEQDKPEDLDKKDSNSKLPDENMHLFVYGNLKIIDKETGEVLVNKPF
jgi:hypothetical protein